MSQTTCSCPNNNCLQGTCACLMRDVLCSSGCKCYGGCKNGLSLETINPAAVQGTTPTLPSASSAAQDSVQTLPLVVSSSTTQGIAQPEPLAPSSSTVAVPKPGAVGEHLPCNCKKTRCKAGKCRCYRNDLKCIMGRCMCYDCDNNPGCVADENYKQCGCKISKCKAGSCACNKRLKGCNPNCRCIGCENQFGKKGEADNSNAGPGEQGGMGGTSDAGGSGVNKRIRIK